MRNERGGCQVRHCMRSNTLSILSALAMKYCSPSSCQRLWEFKWDNRSAAPTRMISQSQIFSRSVSAVTRDVFPQPIALESKVIFLTFIPTIRRESERHLSTPNVPLPERLHGSQSFWNNERYADNKFFC